MRIEVVDHVAGAARARGIALVIDVFRAFTVAPHLVAAGASRVIPVAAVEDALALRERLPGVVLVGERHARRLPGFDAGNSPTEVVALDVAGRPVAHTTHAGTQGLVAATAADEVLAASLVNVSALVRYVRARAPDRVTIVRMGHEARERCAEDDLCAEVLLDLFEGGCAPSTETVRQRLHDAPAARKFFDPSCDWAPRPDFDYCTEVDRFDFVLKLWTAPDGLRELERVDTAVAA
ncbi:MAG: putative 2-phosphosulfolactate phosphatase [Steroidobacteraceae bacterium]|nr:putative 2-phosphosulfolactate phosphatase [Steroidobacteraceae bacterium]